MSETLRLCVVEGCGNEADPGVTVCEVCWDKQYKTPPPPAGLDTLDFEAMWRKAHGLLEDGSHDPDAIGPGKLDRQYLRELVQKQCAALIAQAREEERAKANEFGVGVSRVGVECSCEQRVAALQAALAAFDLGKEGDK